MTPEEEQILGMGSPSTKTMTDEEKNILAMPSNSPSKWDSVKNWLTTNIGNPTRAMVFGAGDSATMGTLPYGGAGLELAGNKLGLGGSDTYSGALQNQKSILNQIKSQNPNYFMVGQAAGMIAPGAAIAKGGQAIAEGISQVAPQIAPKVASYAGDITANAGAGAVQGTADSGDVKQGVGTGILSGLLGGAGKAVGDVVSLAAQKMQPVLQRINNDLTGRAIGFFKGNLKKLAGVSGAPEVSAIDPANTVSQVQRYAHDSGIIPKNELVDTTDIYQNAHDNSQKVGKQIGNMYDDLDKKYTGAANPFQLGNQIESQLKDIYPQNNMNKDLWNQVSPMVDDIKSLPVYDSKGNVLSDGEGETRFSDLHDLFMQMGRKVFGASGNATLGNDTKLAMNQTRGLLGDKLIGLADEAATTDPKFSGLSDLNHQYFMSSKIEDAAFDRLMSEKTKKNLSGLMVGAASLPMAGAEALQGHPLGALATAAIPVVHHLGDKYGAGTISSMMDTVLNHPEQIEQSFGPAASVIKSAAARGPSALASTLYSLYNKGQTNQ